MDTNGGDKYNLRLLYVEDEQDTMEPMLRFLKRRFRKVIPAKNGQEGLQRFLEYKPDLIITDLLLPDLSGMELIEKIRKNGYQNPIVVTSALKDASSIVKTVDIGISKYIIKPIDLEELDVALKRFATLVLPETPLHTTFYSGDWKLHEANMKRQFSAIVKKYSGKGPADVKIFLHDDQIEVALVQFYTAYEQTLLQEEKNISLVEHNRQVFYKMIRVELEDVVSEELGLPLHISNISIDSTSEITAIHFRK